MRALDVSLQKPVLGRESTPQKICAGCRTVLGKDYFVSPEGVKYCVEGCYMFYNED